MATTAISTVEVVASAQFQNSGVLPTINPQLTTQKLPWPSHPHDGLHLWQFMVSGSAHGVLEHMAMFPADTVKTRMQAIGSCPMRYASISQAVQSIIKYEAPAGLCRGIAAMSLSAGPPSCLFCRL